jgi:hypothetical protein
VSHLQQHYCTALSLITGCEILIIALFPAPLAPCREGHVSAFTRTIYFQGIAVSTAFGDTSPLVGHNAFLRWSSLRAVSLAATVCHVMRVYTWSSSVLAPSQTLLSHGA